PDAAASQLAPAEDRRQRLGERVRVAQLAADHDARLERLAGDLEELRTAVVGDPGRRELGGADLQADEPLRSPPLARRIGAAGPRGLRLRTERELPLEQRLLDLLGLRRFRGLRLRRSLRLAAERDLLLEDRLLGLLLLRLRGQLGRRDRRLDTRGRGRSDR